MQVTVTLTTEQINLLGCYILMTQSFREDEAESWRKLAREKKPDGTPVYKYAESNAKYWENLGARLTEIEHLIEGAKWTD